MKKFVWVALAFALAVVPSHAQSSSPVDVSTGYSYLRIAGSDGASGINLNGGTGSVSFNANQWLGLVGDFGFYHGSPEGVSTSATTYMFGPRFTYRAAGRVMPFGEALFGGSHLALSFEGESASTNPFAYSFGGGADLPVDSTGKITVRPEVEYLGMRENGSTQNSVRISVGLVFHIGAR
jgi:outer membrane immunogenic protein